jgi:hypothetical protein
MDAKQKMALGLLEEQAVEILALRVAKQHALQTATHGYPGLGGETDSTPTPQTVLDAAGFGDPPHSNHITLLAGCNYVRPKSQSEFFI